MKILMKIATIVLPIVGIYYIATLIHDGIKLQNFKRKYGIIKLGERKEEVC